jgi:hypothetical protein
MVGRNLYPNKISWDAEEIGLVRKLYDNTGGVVGRQSRDAIVFPSLVSCSELF